MELTTDTLMFLRRGDESETQKKNKEVLDIMTRVRKIENQLTTKDLQNFTSSSKKTSSSTME